MEKATQHTFQVLTKRHQRLKALSQQLKWPPNVWMGVSVENQHWADERIPALIEVPAAVRFLSIEPLLKPVNVSPFLDELEWVIVGGESGPKARPIQPEWVEQIRDDCSAAGVPFFFKQLGGRTSKSGGNKLNGRTWVDMPSSSIKI
jgi:protein gp37